MAEKNLSTLVLGLGGGSVIDVAKAVSIMILNPGEVLDVSTFRRGIDLSLSFSYNIPVSKKKIVKAITV